MTYRKCWSCQAEISELFCSNCRRIQPVDRNVDYFSFLGLLRTYAIDREALDRKFYELSRQLHPDFFANASAQELVYSTENASLLNDAYRTLKDNRRRARYLLELQGVKLTEKLPPDLLEDVFELNEQLELLRQKQLHPEEVSQIKQTKQKLLERLQKLESELSETFARSEVASETERFSILAKAAEILAQMKYLDNLINTIEDAEL
ncbi:MAG: Fe-S protein assembly co-chaperone HscB [Acidobacteriota bacterium]|nr:Fe-S protein assembly co-chaperone HscB [Blastocatellia bacterium]MDW8413271.1 Fe-S protein assembly co-chaperone HscB [Acidobacteriota bacterium]